MIKAGFSRQIALGERRTASRVFKGERGLWQRRYWEHLIRGERDFARHVDYIHYNPVKHGYVTRASDWLCSSLHRYIRQGVVDHDWGVNGMEEGAGKFGER